MEYANFGAGAITYTGQFCNGFRHGEGRALFHYSNSEYEGEWVCDEPIGLKIFQHNGPLVQEEESDEEGDLFKSFLYRWRIIPPQNELPSLPSLEVRLRGLALKAQDLQQKE
jgi:hypothetical protein